jgi:ribosomal protein S18 acetylase RimI-like enzyme
MSRIGQRFEDEEIIMKKQASHDKRQYSLYLTDKGTGIYNNLVKNANIGVAKMIENLSEKELSKLVSSMETIETLYTNEPQAQPVITIRPFQPGDLGYVAYLHGRLYDRKYQFGPMFEYYVMKGLTEFMMNTDGGELWVAEVDSEIVGSIAITKSSDTVAQLRWFVLDENYQGMGIGKQLMETSLNFCKENLYEHVFLWTVSTLTTARHLYQKYQFKLTEEKPNEEWTGTTLMEERWDLDLSE